MYTVRPGIWKKKLKNVENEKCTLQDLKYGDRPDKLKNESRILEYWEYGEKTEKMWKMKHTHSRTGKIGRNTEKREK